MNMICRLTAAVIVVVLALSTEHAAAQEPSPLNARDLCHMLGEMASIAAVGRTNQVPISEVLRSFHNSTTVDRFSATEQKIFAVIVAEIERVVFAVYKSHLTPDDAYIHYRNACLGAKS